jgi:hypothetical protein
MDASISRQKEKKYDNHMDGRNEFCFSFFWCSKLDYMSNEGI